MHGLLETDGGFTLMGADTPPGMDRNPGDNISISLSGDDATTCAATGRSCRTAARSRCRWRSRCGAMSSEACVDRFGVSWMVDIGQPQP